RGAHVDEVTVAVEIADADPHRLGIADHLADEDEAGTLPATVVVELVALRRRLLLTTGWLSHAGGVAICGWHDARVTVSGVAPPSVGDPAVAGASRLIGGPWGRFAGTRSWLWLTPLRVVLVLTILTSLLGFLQKSSCSTHPWSNDYQYTHVCYTDVF